MMRGAIPPARLGALVALLFVSVCALAGDPGVDPEDVASARAKFIGSAGFGIQHPAAPAEVAQFGRLVGIWGVEQEIRMRDLTWFRETPGVWIWKYAADGFGTQDFWYQNASRLPSYMENLGHDYVLTALRIYDAAAGMWRVAWVSNSGGGVSGAVFGSFEARFESGEIVMRGSGAAGIGEQRIAFSDMTDQSFRWRSEYSQDGGASWTTFMRLTAHRIE